MWLAYDIIIKNGIYLSMLKKKSIPQHSNNSNGLQSNIVIKYIYSNFLPKVLPVATTKIKSNLEH